MKFIETTIADAFIVEMQPMRDERGHFARTWCQFEFESRRLASNFVQCSTSFNEKSGTLRGLHFQRPPHMEAKLVRCTRGAAFDVMVDLRRASPSFGQWIGVEISADNGKMVYIPEGVAHGFQTLAAETELFYQISTFYAPDYAAGIRWDDPDLAICWPDAPGGRIISQADGALPLLRHSKAVARPLAA